MNFISIAVRYFFYCKSWSHVVCLLMNYIPNCGNFKFLWLNFHLSKIYLFYLSAFFIFPMKYVTKIEADLMEKLFCIINLIKIQTLFDVSEKSSKSTSCYREILERNPTLYSSPSTTTNVLFILNLSRKINVVVDIFPRRS